MPKDNEEDKNFYKGNSLLKVFGISSIAMLIVTFWMVLDDYGREWKGVQREFLSIKKAKYEKQIEEENAKLDQNKIKELSEQLAAKQKELEGREADKEKLEKELVRLKTQEKLATLKYQDEKLRWDVKKYDYESEFGHQFSHHAVEALEALAHQEQAATTPPPAEGDAKHEEAKEALAPIPTDPHAVPAHVTNPRERAAYDKVLKSWDEVMVLKNKASQFSQQVVAKEAEIKDFNADYVRLEKELKASRGDLDRLQAGKDATVFTVNKLIRNAPVLDMANPTLRVQQIVLPTIRDDIFFSQVQKVDRCTTCHLAIDTPGFEDQKNPYKTHPRLDLMLGSRSPHPIDRIGCTVCHEGRGQAVEFSRAAHTPRNEEQRKEWEKKHGYHEVHHIIERMLPLQYTGGKCHTCHRQTEYVPKAEKHNSSVQLIKSAGCYGCHRIEGWDHLRKPAPSLKRVKGKLSRDWMVKWVSNPKSFNDAARMPSSFFQSNVEGNEEYIGHQKAEVNAIVDYILQGSEDYSPNVRMGSGNADRGKQIFGTVGCLACHQVNDFEKHQGRFGQAPDLSTVGSKVSKDWLTSWLKNPRHYWAETTMPSLRLSESEIADVAAYLLTKKNTEFEVATPVETSEEAQRKVLKLYLMRDPKMAPATTEKVDDYIATLKSHEVTQKLGAFAVTRYGCFGCHEIKGYETTQGIGTELTEWASKLTNKLDFGLMGDLEKTHYTWVDAKLTNTRVFDTGILREYLDLLRMPQYGFNKEERDRLITGLLGFTAQRVQPASANQPPTSKVLNAREADAEEGMRLIHKYNCQGCHVVEGLFQPLPDGHPNKDEHDKKKYMLEGRILTHYAEDETLGPPALVTEGPRVWPRWVHSFLHDPSNSLRYKLKVRMPTFQFTNEEVNKITAGWAAMGGTEFPFAEQKPIQMTPENRRAAEALFNKLQCANCHMVSGRPSSEDFNDPSSTKGIAPNLDRSYGRLTKKWIVELLKDPAKMVPGARMPGFWPEMQSPLPDILGGDSEKQIDVLADYVLSLGQGRGQARAETISRHLQGGRQETPAKEASKAGEKKRKNAE